MDRELTDAEQLTNAETMRHVLTVRAILLEAVEELVFRARNHDVSKFSDPEVAFFAKHTEGLKHLVYGSEEYRAELRKMKPAIDHHYAHNPHHPEYHDGIMNMNLFDLLEMLCDWKASGLRHTTGSLQKSLAINVPRYEIPPVLERILQNTLSKIDNLAAVARVHLSYPHVEDTPE